MNQQPTLIQLTSCMAFNNSKSEGYEGYRGMITLLFGLANNGTVWRYHFDDDYWEQMASLPKQDDE